MLVNTLTVSQTQAIPKAVKGTLLAGLTAGSAVATIAAAKAYWKLQDERFGPAMLLLSAVTLTSGLATIATFESN